jgi:glycerol transport system ATP-binding protein
VVRSICRADLGVSGAWRAQPRGGAQVAFALDVQRCRAGPDGRRVAITNKLHGLIRLDKLRHSYQAKPMAEADWALKNIDLEWSDGGAYALLGPSGCGKTTLLNLISGLLRPTEGRIRFGERDVTTLEPGERNIAQVFQFPVVYDTMSVFDNLAFPLRNRGLPEAQVKARVVEIAAMLELTPTLHTRAAGLTADGKQKISLGRGLVRADVAPSVRSR